MTETAFQAGVMELARSVPGALAHHCRDSRLCDGDPGFPDTIIAAPGGLLAAEIKLPGRRPHGGQVSWKYTLQAAGIPYYVWEPADLESGLIECHIRART